MDYFLIIIEKKKDTYNKQDVTIVLTQILKNVTRGNSIWFV